MHPGYTPYAAYSSLLCVSYHRYRPVPEGEGYDAGGLCDMWRYST